MSDAMKACCSAPHIFRVLSTALLLLALPSAGWADDGTGKADGASAITTETNKDWAEAVRQTEIYKDEPLLLIMHSAKDCEWCARWKGFLGGKHDFESWAQNHPGDRLVIVERSAIAATEVSDDYPDELQWLYQRNLRRGHLKSRTPMFEVVVGKHVVWHWPGYYSWDKAVFPAIKDLDSRRLVRTE